MSDKKAQQFLKELFIICRKINISVVFITQSYFSVPKDVRLNCTHYIIFKLNKKTLLLIIQLILIILIIKIYRNCIKELFNFLNIDRTKALEKKFIKNFDESPL